jgi:glycosyltransferase involved in cell wall biosynthesis
MSARLSTSICVPAFNAGHYLLPTLRSLVQQTVMVDEILLCDNGSTDRTAEILAVFAREHRHLPVRIQSKSLPGGMVADWNEAVEACLGERVLLLPADDWLEPHAVEEHLRAWEDQKGDLVFSCSPKGLLTGRGRRLRIPWQRTASGPIPSHSQDGGAGLQRAVRSPWNSFGEPGAVLFRKDLFLAVGGFDPTFRYYPDLDLWLRLLEHGSGFRLKTAVYFFRLNPQALTGSNQRIAWQEWLLLYQKHAVGVGLPVRLSLGHRNKAWVQCLTRAWMVRILSAL